ncbi:ABC transporter ATP-binding protein [Kineococcus gynurae]|uniref:ABC transporter ATP-binding protein n=1 Tax=Kineococcus gynurae TaxID=452979 RepID=A0ABV5LQX4_9ACTN
MTLDARTVSWDRGGRLVVDGVSLAPAPGETVGLLGPNGSGKSSLLRLLDGVVRPTAGVVALDGRDLTRVPRREVARAVAVVGQHAATEVDLTVREVVELGRLPHRTSFGGDRAADEAAVAEALARTGLTDKAEQLWRRLSGGEQQRAHIARALAQQPRELLLDEPTNHLDIRHQLDVLDLVTRLPVTTVVALHDLNLAAMFCDTVLVLRAGRAVAAGTPAAVLTPELIADVYGVAAEVGHDAEGRPSIRYRVGVRV